jgi:hypothetical protein
VLAQDDANRALSDAQLDRDLFLLLPWARSSLALAIRRSSTTGMIKSPMERGEATSKK